MIDREPSYPAAVDKEQLIDLIRGAGLPVYESVIAFQEQFAGIEYAVRSPTDHIRFSLVRFYDGEYVVDGFVGEDGHAYFECAEHDSAQVNFYIDNSGQLFVGNVTLHPIASSVEKCIEADAVLFELNTFSPRWTTIDFGTIASGDKTLDQAARYLSLDRIDEASDEFSTWWQGHSTYLCRRAMWGNKGGVDMAFAATRTRFEAERLAKSLEGVLKSFVQ